MNTQTYLAIFFIAASLAVATISIATPVSAEKPDKTGLEKADENVHENAPENDVTFHEGTCQGGHTTEALENLGGCDILSKPGNSDDNRQDD